MSASSSMTATRSSVRLIGPAVLDHFSLDQIDDHLADVRGTVADALEVLADEREADRAGDVARILEHVGQQLTEGLLREQVDFVIAGDHFASERGVAAYERVERLAD